MILSYCMPEDIEIWMLIVNCIRVNFPGLETQAGLDDYKATVLKFMGKRQAICIKTGGDIVGVMLFPEDAI